MQNDAQNSHTLAFAVVSSETFAQAIVSGSSYASYVSYITFGRNSNGYYRGKETKETRLKDEKSEAKIIPVTR